MGGDPLGFIYFITNPAWPGVVGVGKTADHRVRLTKYQTSSPYRDFEFPYIITVENRHIAERIAHRRLRGFRIGNTEWFRCDPYDAYRLVLRAIADDAERAGSLGVSFET